MPLIFLYELLNLFYLFHFSDRRGDHEYKFSTSTSLLVSILGQKKYRNFSQITEHARTTSTSEQCFFCLLLLVTCIYAIGILTALVLLCFHMWMDI